MRNDLYKYTLLRITRNTTKCRKNMKKSKIQNSQTEQELIKMGEVNKRVLILI